MSIKKNIDTGLFLVSLLPGKKASEITHIKELNRQIIKWEKPKKRDRDPQCRRCGTSCPWHISRNCNCPYRCVKCDQKHLPGECQRTATDSSEPYCVNCGKLGHPANWRGCPSYKAYVAARRKKVANAMEIKSIAQNNVSRALNMSILSPGKTFASHFKTPVKGSETSQKPPLIQQFLELANLFLEPEVLSLEQEIEIFLNTFQKKSKAEAKQEFLRLLTKVKSIYGP